jgi:hypothetical protein
VKDFPDLNTGNAMRVAYLTTDEVNEWTALQLAEACGATLYPFEPRDTLPEVRLDAVIYDLDYLPAELRQGVLAECLAGPPSGVVGMHSYNLEEDQMETLARHGVVVSQHLSRELFLLLCQAAEQVREARSLEPGAEKVRTSTNGRFPGRLWVPSDASLE